MVEVWSQNRKRRQAHCAQPLTIKEKTPTHKLVLSSMPMAQNCVDLTSELRQIQIYTVLPNRLQAERPIQRESTPKKPLKKK